MAVLAVEAPKPPRGKPPIKQPEKMKVYLEKMATYKAWLAGHSTIDVVGSGVNSQALEIIAPPETEETDAERVLRISGRFDIMWRYTLAVSNGKCRSFIISGAPGVGKSYTIEQVLSAKKEEGELNYRIVSGAVTGIELYKALYIGRSQDYVLVLDDADGIFLDNNGVSILKAALDSKKVRNISWLSNANQLKGVPDQFQYEGRMIFITNLSFDQYAPTSKLGTHMKAFRDRSVYLDLCLHTKRDIMAWVLNLVTKNHLLVQLDLSYEQEKMILDFMQENRDKFKSLSVRTAMALARHFTLFGKEWEASAKQLFLEA